jgi:hypothetical protein
MQPPALNWSQTSTMWMRSNWSSNCHGVKEEALALSQKTMTLEAEEFIRRFLLHVLPEGFQRIRYYGFLANRYREQKLGDTSRKGNLHTLRPSKNHSTKI